MLFLGDISFQVCRVILEFAGGLHHFVLLGLGAFPFNPSGMSKVYP